MTLRMKINFKLVILQSVISIFSFVPLHGQPSDAAFRNLTSADGLPTTTVTDVTQDAFGLIWIGTWDGAYRYDGHTFKLMTGRDARYLTADKKGGVWICYDHSAGYYDPYTDMINNYEIPNAERFGDIGVDGIGEVWIATEDGIVKLDSASHRFIKDENQRPGIIYQLSARGDGVLLFQFIDKKSKQQFIGRRNSKGIYTYESYPVDGTNQQNEKLFTGVINVFLCPIDSTGTLIVSKSGWVYKNGIDSNWIYKKFPNNGLRSWPSDVKTDANGDFWLNQIDTLSKINIVSGEKIVYAHNASNPNSLLSFKVIGTGSNMFFDRQGILWITRFSYGISRLNLFESDFGLLKDSTGSPIKDVLSELELKDGSYWIGSRILNNGLIHFAANGKIIKRYGSENADSLAGKTVGTELSHPFAWALAQTSDGSIWVGGGSPGPHSGGVSRIRPGTNQITRFKNDPSDPHSISDDWIGYILVDGSDRVWLFTDKGMCFIDPVTEKVSRGIKSTGSDSADMAFYLPGLITSAGDLIIENPQEFKNYIVNHKTLEKRPFGVSTNSIEQLHYVHQDNKGRIWFLSNKGFGYLDSSFTRIAYYYQFAKKGVAIADIVALNSDKEGKIWLATTNGIYNFDPATEQFTHFGFDRGLQGNNFSGATNYRGPSGKIYFGGNGGINIFNPEDIKTNPYPPEMIFTGLKLDGKSITFGKKSAIHQPIFAADKITVGPGVLTISIDFAAIHFAGENSNQYQYKLQGFDKDWRDGGNIGNATYTNLSPGKYTLYIKGSNWDDVWSDGKKSIEITVLPPWWQTWWAYTLYGLLILLVLWRFFRYQKIRTIRKERERTQQRELKQAKEIEKAYKELKSTQAQLIQSEKMASLGELTAGIAHEIQNPLNFVNNFSEVNTELIEEAVQEIDKGNIGEVKFILGDIKDNSEKINHHGKRAGDIVKGMLQHSRTSSGIKEPTDINVLCDEYLRLSYHGLRAKDKSFNATMKTHFDESIGKINIIPQDIGRVLLNLYNNAFYATSEKLKAESLKQNSNYEPLVSIQTKKEGNRVLITVSDNGNGIPEKIVNKIFHPFFTTKPTGQGTGLGLSLSYDIIKAHGGEIKVETEEGQGSSFNIQLPS